MKKRGLKGLTEVGSLGDDEVRDVVLGNWHKLNRVLRSQPAYEDLERLLVLELQRIPNPRPNIAERLRSAIQASRSRKSKEGLAEVLRAIKAKKPPTPKDLIHAGLCVETAELEHFARVP